MKFTNITRAAFWLFLPLLSFSVAAQNLSDAMKEGLQTMASEQLNADLEVGELEVNSLTDGLTSNYVRFWSRVKGLSDPLNQLPLANEINANG